MGGRTCTCITDINNSGVFFNAILVLIPVILVFPVVALAHLRMYAAAVAACASSDKMGYEIPLSLAGYWVFIRKNRTTCTYLLSCVISGIVRMYRFIGLFCSDRTSSSSFRISFAAGSGSYDFVRFDIGKPLPHIISLNLHLSTIKYWRCIRPLLGYNRRETRAINPIFYYSIRFETRE